MKPWSDPVQPFPLPLHPCSLSAFPGEALSTGHRDSSETCCDHILSHRISLLQPLVLPAGEVKPRRCPVAVASVPSLG